MGLDWVSFVLGWSVGWLSLHSINTLLDKLQKKRHKAAYHERNDQPPLTEIEVDSGMREP